MLLLQAMTVNITPCSQDTCRSTQNVSSFSNYLAAPQRLLKEPFQRLWSNASQWIDNAVPADGEDVLVPETWDLLLDVSTNSLGVLTIQGQLSFRESKYDLFSLT